MATINNAVKEHCISCFSTDTNRYACGHYACDECERRLPPSLLDDSRENSIEARDRFSRDTGCPACTAASYSYGDDRKWSIPSSPRFPMTVDMAAVAIVSGFANYIHPMHFTPYEYDKLVEFAVRFAPMALKSFRAPPDNFKRILRRCMKIPLKYLPRGEGWLPNTPRFSAFVEEYARNAPAEFAPINLTLLFSGVVPFHSDSTTSLVKLLCITTEPALRTKIKRKLESLVFE